MEFNRKEYFPGFGYVPAFYEKVESETVAEIKRFGTRMTRYKALKRSIYLYRGQAVLVCEK